MLALFQPMALLRQGCGTRASGGTGASTGWARRGGDGSTFYGFWLDGRLHGEGVRGAAASPAACEMQRHAY